MEYPCHQCGTTVQEGIAFCPQCNAPQIRVAVAQPLTPAVLTAAVETSSLSPPFLASPLTTRIDWSRAWPTTALAGLIAAVLMMTPLAAFGLGMLIGGSLSVVFYRRRNPAATVTPGMGSRLGMVSGVMGGGIFALLLAAGTVLLHAWGQVRQKIIELIEEAAARNPDPQAREVMEFFKTEQGIALLIVSTLVAFVIFSGLGGALCAILLRRKERR